MVCERTSFYNTKNIFYFKETSRWSYIVENAGANDIAEMIEPYTVWFMILVVGLVS